MQSGPIHLGRWTAEGGCPHMWLRVAVSTHEQHEGLSSPFLR